DGAGASRRPGRRLRGGGRALAVSEFCQPVPDAAAAPRAARVSSEGGFAPLPTFRARLRLACHCLPPGLDCAGGARARSGGSCGLAFQVCWRLLDASSRIDGMRALRVFRLSTLVAVFGLVVLLPVAGWGAEPTEQLKAQLERVVRVTQDPEVKKGGRVAERRAVRKIAEEIFDFGDTARRALARHWAQRSAAEREEFVAVFT